MNLLVHCKEFEELSLTELHDLLLLRNEVFIVEQNCAYQDIDGLDHDAEHILVYDRDALLAYARIFYTPSKCIIGRVIVKSNFRKQGLGHLVMVTAMDRAQIKNPFTEVLELSAQTYLLKFYESHGFSTVGSEYLEDNIPHIKMRRETSVSLGSA